MAGDLNDVLRTTLARIAPGTALRDGLERINRGNTGGLIVLGYDKTVESVCTGGFDIDTEFTATRLRELAKMDGALVVDDSATRILKAAVHLMPDPTVPSDETGTRHRTADRVAKQTGVPVLTVSKSMHIIALYVGDRRYVLDDSSAILARANQALSTLERYKSRLDEVSGTLSALEIEDLVTVKDAVAVIQRLEMVRRIANEIDGYVVELGTDGRLMALQLDELMAGVEQDRELVIRDYLPDDRLTSGWRKGVEDASGRLDSISPADLLDLGVVARAIGLPHTIIESESPVSPRGYRFLAKVPRVPRVVMERIVEHFGTLQKLLAASVEDLQAVGGVGEARARAIREGLSRLADSSLLERFV